MVLLLVYSIFLIRFCIGQPEPSVDYVARLNAPILKAPETDRAWPLWRKLTILASADGKNGGNLVFADAIRGGVPKVPWDQKVLWLKPHDMTAALARAAAEKPSLGFILGSGGSVDDADVFGEASRQIAGTPLRGLFLPHLTLLPIMFRDLKFDARVAAERGDGVTVEADLMAMLGLQRFSVW